VVKRIRKGLFGSITKYKPLWCLHNDWVTVKALSEKKLISITKLIHDMIKVYLECHEQNHNKQIESLNNKVIILAAEVRKYRDRFGIIKD